MQTLFRIGVVLFIALTIRSLFAGSTGGRAPEVHVSTWISAPEDAKASLAEHRGKTVVLEFWATWCGPCVQAIPHMNQLVAAFEGEPVVFMALSEEDEELLYEFVERRPMQAWVGVDPSGRTRSAFSVDRFPTAVVIDGEGSIVWSGHPMQLDASKLRELMN